MFVSCKDVFYLCPTENESISVAQEGLRADNLSYFKRIIGQETFAKIFINKICENKKDLYLCNPNTGSAGVVD